MIGLFQKMILFCRPSIRPYVISFDEGGMMDDEHQRSKFKEVTLLVNTFHFSSLQRTDINLK